MVLSQDELEALKAQVAQLTARIYKLEQQAGLAAGFPQQEFTPAADVPPQRPAPVVEESAPKIQDKTSSGQDDFISAASAHYSSMEASHIGWFKEGC